jgi:hypothetical protein
MNSKTMQDDHDIIHKMVNTIQDLKDKIEKMITE